VVAPAGSGKTEALRAVAARKGCPVVNLSLELSRRLLDVSTRQRPIRASSIVDDIVRGYPGDVVVVDNLELLFAPELELDPLRMLKHLGRDRTVIAAWPGTIDGSHLRYAEPGHPEARDYPVQGTEIVNAGTSEGAGHDASPEPFHQERK